VIPDDGEKKNSIPLRPKRASELDERASSKHVTGMKPALGQGLASASLTPNSGSDIDRATLADQGDRTRQLSNRN